MFSASSETRDRNAPTNANQIRLQTSSVRQEHRPIRYQLPARLSFRQGRRKPGGGVVAGSFGVCAEGRRHGPTIRHSGGGFLLGAAAGFFVGLNGRISSGSTISVQES